MAFSIIPYNGDSMMKPWPALADRAFCLTNDSRQDESIFFYDFSPAAAYRTVIVLVHGLGDEADSWRHLIPLLNKRGYRVLAPDLPGFGRSVALGKINLKKHAAAVLQLIEAACPGAKVILAGNSLGAIVAADLAFKKPGLASGLIMIDASIPGGVKTPGLFALAGMLFSRKWYRSYRTDPERAWASLYPYYAGLDAMPGEDKAFLKRRVMARVQSSAQEEAFFQTQRSIVWAFISAASKITQKIEKFDGKTLLIWGENDRIIPISSAAAFKAGLTKAELKTIPGAGHLPQQEKPQELAKLIADFADGLLYCAEPQSSQKKLSNRFCKIYNCYFSDRRRCKIINHFFEFCGNEYAVPFVATFSAD